ncbi:MAG: Wzz/FepE/Etk N-terminal domain-containing protein [Bacillota bacterium]
MDEEIDLRAYAEVLWRARYVVAGVTLAAALVAFALSRFALPRVYEASTLVVVEAPNEEPTAPVMVMALTPGGYKEIVDSAAFQGLIQERVSRSADAAPHAQVRVRARVVPQTNLLELSVEAPHPDVAALWANEATAVLLQEVERLNQTRMERALVLLESQIQQSRKNLNEAQQRLQEFIERGPSVDRLQNEQAVKLKLIADYQNRLASLNVALVAETTKLETLKAQLAKQPWTITLSKALSPEGAAAAQALRNLGLNAGEPLMNLEDEQLNPVYVELQQQVALQEATVAALNRSCELLNSHASRNDGVSNHQEAPRCIQ